MRYAHVLTGLMLFIVAFPTLAQSQVFVPSLTPVARVTPMLAPLGTPAAPAPPAPIWSVLPLIVTPPPMIKPLHPLDPLIPLAAGAGRDAPAPQRESTADWALRTMRERAALESVLEATKAAAPPPTPTTRTIVVTPLGADWYSITILP